MNSRFRRFVKHLWLDQADTRRAIGPAALQRLRDAVTVSERRHSGEIRIFVEAGLPLAYVLRKSPSSQLVRQRALALFGELRVWDTAGNNGVLIYLLLAERKIEIVADRGLNDLVDAQTWQSLVARMSGAFATGRFEEGLAQALAEVSSLLEQHFALASAQGNRNELPDTPMLG
ncbi:MAG: TPM domain-containing protein [Rhodoferax sp.]|nr:TPM domain-containing protein [Rhodoferax sp.]